MNSKADQLINALRDPSIYEHEANDISIIETHISWVVLTGPYAYKIKKPIKYSFVDFSTLKKRKFYCDEEIRLNSRLAPNLYLEVVAITGSYEYPSFKKSGDAIEFAVKMRQFPQQSLLSTLSVHGQLHQQHIDDMAVEVAKFHANIDKVSVNNSFGTPEDINYWILDNFKQIETNLVDKENLKTLNYIKVWGEREFHNKFKQLQLRRTQGFIRECHGDMHLGNMVLIEGKVTIFDGIDFNEHLRWIDVMSEVAFVMMDLNDRGHPNFANRFINRYLQQTGDFEGLCVFQYYLVYRAIVRAKVALLRIAQKHMTKPQQEKIQEEFSSYIKLASRYIDTRKVALIITCGFSGSGKSTYTEPLLEAIGAIRIRSDVERKRIYGYKPSQNTQSKIDEGIYSSQSSRETYTQLTNLSKSILNSGFTVIVDACFLRQGLRHEFYTLALELKVPFIILDFQASEDTLKQRIIFRAQDKLEPSEADLAVLRSQVSNHEPLDRQEENYTITVNTEEEVQINEIAKTIENRVEESPLVN